MNKLPSSYICLPFIFIKFFNWLYAEVIDSSSNRPGKHLMLDGFDVILHGNFLKCCKTGRSNRGFVPPLEVVEAAIFF